MKKCGLVITRSIFSKIRTIGRLPIGRPHGRVWEVPFVSSKYVLCSSTIARKSGVLLQLVTTLCATLYVMFCYNGLCYNETQICRILYIDGFAQDCSISIALAMEILQSCTEPSIYFCPLYQLLCIAGIILNLGMGFTYERRHYCAMPSLIGWAHTLNDPCIQWTKWRTHTF